MKSYLLAVGLLILLCPFQTQSQKRIGGSSSTVSNPVDNNWLQQAEKFISEMEYDFRQSGQKTFEFYTANRKQKTGFTFTGTSYVATPIDFTVNENSKNWKVGFEFLKLARGKNELFANEQYTTSFNKSDLRYQFPGFAIEYINREVGLRQNFIVSEKLAGEKDLELLLSVKTDLVASVTNNELIFRDKNKVIQLYYKDLNVWDANHQPLKAFMELRDNNTVAIVVDDKLARYPITIDPLNQTPDWTTSADGILPGLIGQLAVNAAYGFSVAGLGDINGDGFDDVAVGAPTMVDLIAGTGTLAAVGAVFVYYGSASGLPTTPGARLQPTTLVTGALFGYSIAGGDVNGDGKNDILVGAPMDNVIVALGGSSTASGRVGKVYGFNGATLHTNTTPLITIQLSENNIISNVNISVNALFGFSVAVTEDLNADGKKDIIVGAPTYAGIKTVLFQSVLDVQSGGAFVFLTKSGNNTFTQVKLEPIKQDLLDLGLLSSNINGLLFGYAVDGTGDYNGDGRPDVVATAPAGINAGSISGLLNGKLLQGSAEVYYGTGTSTGVNTNPGAILTATSGGLLTNLVGSIANVANLFGVSVKGVRGSTCARNGNIIVGAPIGNAVINVLGLDLKTGTVSVFKKKTSSPSGYVSPDQVLASPRNSNNILQIIQANLLFGYSLDNICDINCDGYADIIVGEPISSGVQLVNANVAGGAAYVYYGNASGLYQTSPGWTLTAYEDEFLGINATSLIGYSVAGAGRVQGAPYNYCILVGSPSRTLDFGEGLLDLGSTLGTLFSLVAGHNGVGKAFLFDIKTCDHQPVAVNDLISTNEDTPVNGNAATNDTPSLDGGNIWSLVNPNGGALHGTVTMNPDGSYTYTPAPDYNGTDVFTYQLCDIDNDCSTATVSVTINPVDDMPVAVNDVTSTNEDTPVSGDASPNDTPSGDGGNIWSLVNANGGALHGTVTMNPDGTYTYTPAADYNGTDVFTYKLCDADNDCSTATVTITIAPVDDVPIAVNDAVTTNEDTPITNATVAGNDTPSGDGGNVWSVTGSPQHGTVVMNPNGTYTYTPAANYNGSDAFSYKLCDADNDCSTATVSITITPVDDAPTAVNDEFTTSEDTPITNGSVAGNDIPSGDCPSNAWSVVTGPAHGTVTMNTNGTFTYTPTANYSGPDQFTYKLCDCDGDCSNATVNITVNPVDDAPIAVNDAVTTTEDTPITNATVIGNDTPSGDGGNVWSVTANPQHGTVVMNPNGTYTYTPAANYNGNDAFTYKLCDADNDCSTATVSITITPVDDAPVAANDQFTTTEDTPITNGSAATNDTPSGDCPNDIWSVVTGPAHGTVTMNTNGTFTYTPAANYSGPDQFTYKLCDCDGDCSNATVNITVNPVDDTPIAVNDNFSTNEDTPITNGSVTGNDTPSGDCSSNTWSVVTGPAHGTITMNSNGTFTYTPAANYNGPDQFTYKLCDCDGDCSNATVNITVNPVDDTPAAVNDNFTTNEDTPITNSSVAGNDTQSGDCPNNTWSVVTGPAHGTVTMSANGTFTYTPAANYNGPDQFTYKLCDCDGDCANATVNITVNPVDDMPIAVNDNNTTAQNTPVNGNAASNDTPSGDGGNIWSIVTGPANGTATMNANGTYTYTPATGFNGNDSFTYKLCDADNDCSTATVSIVVTSPCGTDQIPPSITCPSNKTVAVGANCAIALDDYKNQASASDNCTATASIIISQSPAPGTVLSGTGTTVVTLTARDANGNTATCSFTVTRVDQTAPTLTCQPNKTVGCNAAITFDAPTASDNCGTPTVTDAGITTSGNTQTKTWKATDGSGNTATCSQTVTQTPCTGTGHIFPTSTTCNSYLNGAAPLAQLCYSFRNNKVSNITPGVFFYFTTITAPSTSFTVDIVQTNSCPSFSLFAIQQGNQITAFSSGCTNVASGTQIATGQGRITINNATPGAQYVISVKYDSKSVLGSTFTGSAPTCQYNFVSKIGGNVIAGSEGSINLRPNCSSGATTKVSEPQPETEGMEAQIGLFPNPAAEYVNVLFVPAHTAKSSIEMYDITGKLVMSIYNGEIEEGKPYQRRIATNNLASGVYLIKFRNGEFIETKKLVIAK